MDKMSKYYRFYISRFDWYKLKLKRTLVAVRFWLAKKLLPENQWTFLKHPDRQVKTYLLDESAFVNRDVFLNKGARAIKKSLVVDMIEEITSYAKMDVIKASGDNMVECRATLRIIR